MTIYNRLKQTLGLAIIGATVLIGTSQAATQTMIVAGGCFWCVESDYEAVEGVSEVVSGYIGGHTQNPTYKQVSSNQTGHFEAVKITFDDAVVSLKTLSDYYWKTIDPTDAEGQFCDKGTPYKTAMFYQSAEQKAVFESSLEFVKTNKPFSANIVTPILAATEFYPAEDYHQNYYIKNPKRYAFYRFSCRRDKKIEDLWGTVESKKHH
ncbi:MAG: peptide-methionine (S)-S-oxide reductase MsrA [Saccharospirillaceae bacterium]|nr:peptide-methionine (S)-S-oxide reductase MsrA [Pseudomonadales bacterium]NRB78909.1 peptide-methionine (S)-S-oxide reductase MsrA [Saccharospirillaceae bacterium]